MKKLLIAATVALSVASTGAIAGDRAAGAAASEAAFGGLTTSQLVFGAVALTAVAIVANSDGSGRITPPKPPVTECPDGYSLVNGKCVKDPEPPGPTQTQTSTVTSTGQ